MYAGDRGFYRYGCGYGYEISYRRQACLCMSLGCRIHRNRRHKPSRSLTCALTTVYSQCIIRIDAAESCDREKMTPINHRNDHELTVRTPGTVGSHVAPIPVTVTSEAETHGRHRLPRLSGLMRTLIYRSADDTGTRARLARCPSSRGSARARATGDLVTIAAECQ